MQDSEVRDFSALCELDYLVAVLCFSAVSVVHFILCFCCYPTRPNHCMERKARAHASRKFSHRLSAPSLMQTFNFHKLFARMNPALARFHGMPSRRA